MASFKEYNNTTFYIGPEGTGNTSTGEEIHTVLYTGYATYPFDTNNNELVWFGLKQGDNFEGVLSQNIDYSNGFNFTSSHSDCWAKIGPQNPAWTPDRKTGMEPYFFIGKSDVYREITFKWKDFVVFKFIQYGHGQPNKLLICKPTWYYQSTASTPIIGFSTSNTKINVDVFHDYAVPDLNKWLCVTEQLNNPNSVHWDLQQIKTISSLKYIEGTDLKNSIYSDYFLINIYKVYDSNNNSIIEKDFDKITNIGLLYIFEMTNEGAKNIGSVTMRKEGTYMLGEIG